MHSFVQLSAKETEQEPPPAMKDFGAGPKEQQPNGFPQGPCDPVLQGVRTGTDTEIDFGIAQLV